MALVVVEVAGVTILVVVDARVVVILVVVDGAFDVVGAAGAEVGMVVMVGGSGASGYEHDVGVGVSVRPLTENETVPPREK